MRGALYIVFASALLALGACGSTRPAATQHVFRFTHDGHDYEIISVVVSADGGHNFLTRRDEGEWVLSAKDENQNGRLDTVLIGDVTLPLANEIYEAGIAEARARGKYREQTGSRIFEYQSLEYLYVVQTFVADSGEWYNSFAHFDINGREVVIFDTDADGDLDRVARGVVDIEASQRVYELALEEGIRCGRILATNGRFVVLPSYPTGGPSR